MSWISAQTAAEWSGGALLGDDVTINAVSTDSRRCNDGDLFIALHGEHYDAHDFIDDALPAAALMVHRAVDDRRPQILVDDTRLALGSLAASWRAQTAACVVGLTGSNGKTTVKQMLASVFSGIGSVMATRGNLNNDIGVPLTLLGGSAQDDFWVVEMGANHPGEIHYLTHIVRPNIALVNNVAEAHLEGFGSLQGVADAKGEIYSGLPDDGVAVINIDDAYAEQWLAQNAQRRLLRFGFSKQADVRGVWDGVQLQLHIADANVSIRLPVPGRHNAANALAAAACAHAAGATLEQIRHGLASFQPADGRLQQQRIGEATVINDAYNANPASFRAAISVLSAQASPRVLVMGDMRELGADAAECHAAIGRAARDAGIDALLTLGDDSQRASAAFGEGALHFDSVDTLAREIAEHYLPQSATVLVKGSRGMRMERVIESLLTAEGGDHAA